MHQRLVIFDMDGTLVNSSAIIPNAINFVRQNLGLSSMSNEDILKLVNDNSINPAKIFYECKRFEPHHEMWFAHYYKKNYKKELALYDGIEALLNLLKKKHFKLAIATNAYRESTLQSLNHLGIKNCFDAIVCYDDVKNPKPHPDMLYRILSMLNQNNKQTIFVGDSPRDQEASLRAKIPYCMVDWGFTKHKHNSIQSIEELKEMLLNE